MDGVRLQVPTAPSAALAAEASTSGLGSDDARRVIYAAEALFQNPGSKALPEPASPALARLAVERFAALFAAAPGVFTEALEGARAGAEVLSTDRLQGLAEIVQNADDAGATRIFFQLEPGELLVTHDGRPVNLRDVLALATPWLTTKRDDASATGRFGIGLMTLQALSPALEVYSGPYAIRLGSPSLEWVENSLPAAVGRAASTTLLRIPFGPGVLEAEELAEWFDRWDDSVLLFLSSVREVEVRVGERPLCMLKLAWEELGGEEATIGIQPYRVRRRCARAQDGRRWIVHTVGAAPPAGVERSRKARGETMPLGVALPLSHCERGSVYAGLPVAATWLCARLHGQFDPTAGRQGLAATPWNSALYPLVTDLWQSAVVRFFAEAPSSAWAVVPLPASDAGTEPFTELEQVVLARARSELPKLISISVGGSVGPLAALAVEVASLSGVITEGETARLAKLPAALPAAVRDEDARWRDVLHDWRVSGAELPPPVDVETALDLFRDAGRDPDAVVTLAAAAVGQGLEGRLAALPCIVLDDGSRTRPPTQADPWMLVVSSGGIGDELGVTRALHPAHLADSTPAKAVLDWLGGAKALVQSPTSLAILGRLARAGDAGQRLPDLLSDRQVSALRDAFDTLSPEERTSVGPGVGRAIQLRAQRFDRRGRRQETVATPAEAYIPQRIEKDREGFAVAAGSAPDLIWLHGRYAEVLRSPGRSGLGPLRFLRLLGAETVPRLTPHPQLEKRYVNERRRGLHIYLHGGPDSRREAMEALGATYTLEDRHSPDLVAVLESIARERKARTRRARAAAILGALDRAWERLADAANVAAASDSYGWNSRGTVGAFWIWQAATIPWLDDARGVPTPPIGLRRRTPGTVAVHGPDAAGYLHKDLQEHRLDVLAALGVAGDPDTGTLVARLRTLQKTQAPDESIATEAAAIYRTLAERLADGRHLPGDLSPARLLAEFNALPGLILTNRGWKRTFEVLNGDPVFGERRAFVPLVQGTKRLWTTLKVRSPSIGDYVNVLVDMGGSHKPPAVADSAIMLECLRFLAHHIGEVTPGGTVERQLTTLPLWTSRGWKARRPVYVVDDLPLADGLKDLVPVWMPGGEVAQFKALRAPLHLTEVVGASASVVDADRAEAHVEATATLRSAVALLKEDLIRNEPAAAGKMRTEWDRLAQLEVRISPTLQVRVSGLGSRDGLVVPVSAKADLNAGILFLRDYGRLARVDGGGRAIASLFGTDPRRLAQAWLAACGEAEAGREAVELRLSEERAAAEQRAIAERLVDFRARTARAHETRPGGGGRTLGSTMPVPAADTRHGAQTASSHAQPKRTLIDPSKYRLVDAQGRVENTTGSTMKSAKHDQAREPLAEPKQGGAPPQSNTSPAQYTGEEKERLGLELLQRVLASEAGEVMDLRGQRRVGADAVDLDRRYYELKVYVGPEPDQIVLEGSQIQRALATPDFFLAIVSDLEGDKARPRVRIVVNPLTQLQVGEKSSIPFTGVRSAHSLVYEFDRDG
jgi:hypothetical protein